jgi:hypothetical protein
VPIQPEIRRRHDLWEEKQTNRQDAKSAKKRQEEKDREVAARRLGRTPMFRGGFSSEPFCLSLVLSLALL